MIGNTDDQELSGGWKSDIRTLKLTLAETSRKTIQHIRCYRENTPGEVVSKLLSPLEKPFKLVIDIYLPVADPLKWFTNS